jgi:hypothetical protein
LPTLFLSKTDISAEVSPVPGLGRITCQELTLETGARALKSALSLGRWVLSHPFVVIE